VGTGGRSLTQMAERSKKKGQTRKKKREISTSWKTGKSKKKRRIQTKQQKTRGGEDSKERLTKKKFGQNWKWVGNEAKIGEGKKNFPVAAPDQGHQVTLTNGGGARKGKCHYPTRGTKDENKGGAHPGDRKKERPGETREMNGRSQNKHW